MHFNANMARLRNETPRSTGRPRNRKPSNFNPVGKERPRPKPRAPQQIRDVMALRAQARLEREAAYSEDDKQ